MSEPLPATTRRAPFAFTLLAFALLLFMAGGPARAETCPRVAVNVVLCTAETEWANERVEHFAEVTAWESEDYFLEFNPALSAAAGDGPADAALERLLAALLEEEDLPEVTPVLRDSFEAGVVIVERSVFRIVEEGETYLAGVMITDFVGGAAPRLAWTLGSFDLVPLEEIVRVIDATAAGLRASTGD